MIIEIGNKVLNMFIVIEMFLLFDFSVIELCLITVFNASVNFNIRSCAMSQGGGVIFYGISKPVTLLKASLMTLKLIQ